MITTILKTAAHHDVCAARVFTSDCLHVPLSDVGETVAVAYVVQHFKQGAYEGWDGFVEMRNVDLRTINDTKGQR